MAKKKPHGEGILVRISPDVVRMARMVAPTKGVTLTDYLSDMLRATVTRDYNKELKRFDKEGGEV